jgi:large subunit ribosomal protein L6
MSRVGKAIIQIPKGVEIKKNGSEVSVKGPKSTLTLKLYPGIDIKIEGDHLEVVADASISGISKFHGLMRALINNMILGVTKGFEKRLEMIGVGYRASVQGKEIDLQVGNSHPTRLPIPEGIQVSIEANTKILVTGADNQKVGLFAASVRAIKPPEPYQGKGIRYKDEYVRKKAGKAAAKSK